MLISDLFRRLSYGELVNLSIGVEGSGNIATERQPHVVSLAQTVLTDMHTRLTLRERECVIHLNEGQSTYRLTPDAAVYGTTPNAPKVLGVGCYIQDSLDEPFTGPMTRIMEAQFCEAPRNVPEDPMEYAFVSNAAGTEAGIVSTVYDRIRVKDHKTGDTIKVTYLEDHPTLPIPVVLGSMIELPPVLEEALQARVASYIYESMDGEGQTVRAVGLRGRYEEILNGCKELMVSGYRELSDTAKLGMKGFR